MFKVNQDYLKLPGSYLFSTVARKQREYQTAHPEAEIIKLSIGDVTQPLAPAIVEALHGAVTRWHMQRHSTDMHRIWDMSS